MQHRDPSALREPDVFGIAVGDLVAGTDISDQSSRVGVVTEIVSYAPAPGMAPTCHRYHIRCAKLLLTGEVVERVVHDRPLVIIPAGAPASSCFTCDVGHHANAELFIECGIEHERREFARKAAADKRRPSPAPAARPRPPVPVTARRGQVARGTRNAV